MNDGFEPRSSKVFILSIGESEIVYFADRDEIASRVLNVSCTAVSSPSRTPGADESDD